MRTEWYLCVCVLTCVVLSWMTTISRYQCVSKASVQNFKCSSRLLHQASVCPDVRRFAERRRRFPAVSSSAVEGNIRQFVYRRLVERLIGARWTLFYKHLTSAEAALCSGLPKIQGWFIFARSNKSKADKSNRTLLTNFKQNSCFCMTRSTDEMTCSRNTTLWIRRRNYLVMTLLPRII